MATLPRGSKPNAVARIRVGAWNRMVDAASRILNLTVAAPLRLKNTATGIELSIQGAKERLKVVPFEAVDGQANRYNAHVIDEQLDPEATGDFVVENLGIVDDENVVQVWAPGGVSLDIPVEGELTDHLADGTPVVFVSGGGGSELPTGTQQHTYFKMVSDNQTGWGRVVGATLPDGVTY
jgi:hypothetical protein